MVYGESTQRLFWQSSPWLWTSSYGQSWHSLLAVSPFSYWTYLPLLLPASMFTLFGKAVLILTGLRVVVAACVFPANKYYFLWLSCINALISTVNIIIKYIPFFITPTYFYSQTASLRFLWIWKKLFVNPQKNVKSFVELSLRREVLNIKITCFCFEQLEETSLAESGNQISKPCGTLAVLFLCWRAQVQLWSLQSVSMSVVALFAVLVTSLTITVKVR